MRLLFIKLKHIGDALLLTPTLTAARRNYPNAEIWVVARRGCESILQGCPAIDRTLISAPAEKSKRGLAGWADEARLVRQLRQQRFDYAFELTDGDRGRALAVLSGAGKRCTNTAGRPLPWMFRRSFNTESKYFWHTQHRVEKDFYTVHDALPLGGEPGPLVFEADRAKAWGDGSLAGKRFAVLHPGTRWQRKRWPAERWQAVTKRLLSTLDHVVISAGPDREEKEAANELLQIDPARVLSTDGSASWAELAWLLHRARLFVGVDTAAMHLAAACQTPMIALFGPSIESEWRPWKANAIVLSPPITSNVTDLIERNQLETQRSISSITVDEVTRACERLLNGAP